jgi:hypothetical protein
VNQEVVRAASRPPELRRLRANPARQQAPLRNRLTPPGTAATARAHSLLARPGLDPVMNTSAGRTRHLQPSPAGERPSQSSPRHRIVSCEHCCGRAVALARSHRSRRISAVVAIPRNMPFQWRKKGGRWQRLRSFVCREYFTPFERGWQARKPSPEPFRREGGNIPPGPGDAFTRSRPDSPNGVNRIVAPRVFGGTPNMARETRALPSDRIGGSNHRHPRAHLVGPAQRVNAQARIAGRWF